MAQNLLDIPQQNIDELKKLIADSNNIVITCHMTPDGDALGSTLSLCRLLKNMGKNTVVITPDAFPDNLSFLPGADNIIVASYNYQLTKSFLQKADLVFCLDFNELARVDRLQPYLENLSAKFVMIDHHTFPSDFADLKFSYPDVSSTCAVLFCVLDQAGLLDFMDRTSATCCCAGMMTDTGNFSYNSNNPLPYLILAQLMQKGVDKDRLYKMLFDTTTFTRLQIMGYCQSEKLTLHPEARLALTTLSFSESERFHFRKGDTEGLVNLPLGIPEIIWSVYLREMEPGKVKISMRSKGNFSVREICAEHFGGGGHHNAAGGEIEADIDTAAARILEIAASLAPVAQKEFVNQQQNNFSL